MRAKGLIALLGALAASGAAPAVASERPHVEGQLVVRFAPSTDGSERSAIRRSLDATVQRSLPVPGAQLLEVDDVPAAEAAFERLPGVLYAEPNFRLTLDGTTDDPALGAQWNLRQVGAPEAWDVTKGSRDIVAAVIDSGVEVDHPDLQGNLWTNQAEFGSGRESNGIDDDGNGYVDDWRGWHFGYGDRNHNDATDYGGHGTHVAGIIGATGDNGIGITGLSPRVSIMPFNVWDKGSAGVAEAIAYADSFGVRVANGSFGIPWSDLIEDALEAAPNLLLSVSAGNQRWNVEENKEERYPCVSPKPNVICVAATDHGDGLADFSNWGSESVDLGAPGVGMPSVGLPQRTLVGAWFDQPLDDRWTTGGTGGSWAVVPQPDAEWPDMNAWGTLNDSPDAEYPNEADTWFGNAEPLDLTGSRGCEVFSYLSHDLAPNDVLRIEASSGGGAWELLSERTGQARFENVIHLLTAYEGRPGLRVRFRLVTDAAGRDRGVRLHHASVFCNEPGFKGDEYPGVGGTSNAAPHIAGTAALLLAHDRALTTAQLREKILGSVKPLPALAGRTVTGGRLDTARALGVVPRLPGPFEAPPPAGPSTDAAATTPPPTPEQRPAPDRSAPRCRPLLRRDRRGLRLVARCDEPARVTVRVSTGRTTLARGSSRARILRLRLTRAGRRVLLRRGARRVTLRLTTVDAAGNRATTTRRVTLA